MEDLTDVKRPKELYPVFYGHYDWHSSVHAHWSLVRLLRVLPQLSSAEKIRAALDRKFNSDALQAEADHLENNPSFERMYGWAWALRLGMELRELNGAEVWCSGYAGIEQAIVKHAKNYLPKLEWPVRCGFHPESSFPISQMLDWARATGDSDFEKLLCERALTFYQKDTNYPIAYEPSGNDFFSSGLNEANLMRRVLSEPEFQNWFTSFLPQLSNGEAGNLLQPVTVHTLDDGHLVHLVGLNLSRAWAMRSIAQNLTSVAKEQLLNAAQLHEQAGLKQMESGSYEGEHWLGTFALYLMTDADSHVSL